jgi:hypothetical protein
MNKYIAALILIGWTLCCSFTANAAGKNQDSVEKVDYAATNQEVQKFEAVINNVITSAFSSSPFAIVQKTKGAYLQGYGISFSFLINIHRAVISTPFGQREEVTPKLKNRRIEELKERLIGALQDNGEIFQQLRKEYYVTIIAFFEDRYIPDEPSINKTLILSALKKDLDEFSHKKDRLTQFKQRIKIIEY